MLNIDHRHLAPDKSRYTGTYLGNKCENQGSDMGSLFVIVVVVIFGVLFIGGFVFIIRSYSKKGCVGGKPGNAGP
jgi:hypothetical protein